MSTPSTVKRSFGRALGVIVGLAGVGAAVIVAVMLIAGVSSLNPFTTRTTEHQDAVVMAKISDLATLEAASGRFTTIVDQQSDTKLPSWATGTRVVLDAE